MPPLELKHEYWCVRAGPAKSQPCQFLLCATEKENKERPHTLPLLPIPLITTTSRLLRHGRSKPNEAGLIVSTRVSEEEEEEIRGIRRTARPRARRERARRQPDPSRPHAHFFPHTHTHHAHPGQRRQAGAWPRPDRPGAGQGSWVSLRGIETRFFLSAHGPVPSILMRKTISPTTLKTQPGMGAPAGRQS
jgi:hypothetical protein